MQERAESADAFLALPVPLVEPRQLRQDDGGAYVGFLGDEGQARVRQAYPGSTWDRLAAIKGRYDPTNLFRRNHNVPPANGDR